MLLGPGDCLQGGGPRDSGCRTTPPTALGTSGSRRGGRASWRCEAAAAGSADRFPSECTCQGVSLSMLRSVLVNMEARRHQVQRRCAASFIILFVCLFLICFPKQIKTDKNWAVQVQMADNTATHLSPPRHLPARIWSRHIVCSTLHSLSVRSPEWYPLKSDLSGFPGARRGYFCFFLSQQGRWLGLPSLCVRASSLSCVPRSPVPRCREVPASLHFLPVPRLLSRPRFQTSLPDCARVGCKKRELHLPLLSSKDF